jgi:apolipoprotein N-acyltransferase
MNLNKFFAPGMLGDSLALMSGALLTLAFAPFNLFPLAIIAPALLLGTWLNVTPKRAFWRGWFFGLGLFSTGVYWVYISIHTFGNAPVWMASLITSGFIALLSLFPALVGYQLNRYFPLTNSLRLLCAFPGLWIFWEWFRSLIFTGFPWLSLGYSQISTPLRGYASLLGVYSVSLVVIMSSGLLVNAILLRKERKQTLINIAALILIWIIGSGLCLVSWTKPLGSPIQVSLIQGNIAQEIKWSPEQVQPTLDRYTALTQTAWHSQIIIWPEAAIPLPLSEADDFVNALSKEAYAHHTAIIAGIPIKREDEDSYYNAAVVIGNGHGFYLKKRLVPFGEYTPFHNFLGPLLDKLQIPMSNFTAAKQPSPSITVNNIEIATFICYEIAFPEQVRTLRENIGILLTISNDAWFGNSIASAQHLQIAQMRSVEMARPSLFVSNTGITAIITAKGKIQAEAPPNQPYVLTGNIQPRVGTTPWQTVGMDPLLIIILSLIFHRAWLYVFKKKMARYQPKKTSPDDIDK